LSLQYLYEIGQKLIEAEREELIKAIQETSGRVIVGETVSFKSSLVDGVTNAELLKSWGVDMVTINHYDVDMPMMPGLPSTEEGIIRWGAVWNEGNINGCRPDVHVVEPSHQNYLMQFGFGRTIGEVKKLVGIPVGMTLEPVLESTDLPLARIANQANAGKGVRQGANYITIIGTPSTSDKEFFNCVSEVHKGVQEAALIKAGKMPWGGVFQTKPEQFITSEEIEKIAKAGADIVVVPAPGTVPGLTIELVRDWVKTIHKYSLLAEVTIGTSQEGADEDVIRRFAIDSKMTGADIFQIGDGVYSGISLPENVMSFANAIKGRRHTLRRAALSPMRGAEIMMKNKNNNGGCKT